MDEKYGINFRKVIKVAILFAVVIAGIFLAYTLAIYLAPFIIAFAIASIIEPVIQFLIRKAGLKRKFAASVTLLLVLFLLGSVLTILISKLVSEIISISAFFPEYYARIYENINALVDKGAKLYLGLPPEIAGNIEDFLSGISNSIMNLLDNFLKSILNVAISLPQIFIFILVTVLSTFFLAVDREKIHHFVKSQLPDKWIVKFQSIKSDLFSALLGYIKSAFILMSITFTELLIGFLIIDVKHPLILAVVISFVDALPILGTGGVMIPWSIYAFLIGDIGLGISVLVIYVIILVVRQLLEPRILAHQIGLYPLLTLIAMYVGLQLFGFFGLILGPITVLLLRNILSEALKSGLFKKL